MTLSTLPGIQFVQQTAELTEELPRTDIAALVGFAQRGPVGVPVVVEDYLHFEDIFGGELELAWDPLEGRMHTAHLASSVRAFFHGGGKRCWVVRVAADSAQYQFFPLAGMLVKDLGRNWRSADIAARSPGAWADQLLVETRLQATELRLSVVSGEADDLGRYEFALDQSANLGSGPVTLHNGELIRVINDTAEGRFEHFLRLHEPVFQPRSRQQRLQLQPVLSALQMKITALASLADLSLRLPMTDGRFKRWPVKVLRKDDGVMLVVGLEGNPEKIAIPQSACVLLMDYDSDQSRQAAIKLETVSYEQDIDGQRLKLTVASAWQVFEKKPLSLPLKAAFKAERLCLSLKTHDSATDYSLQRQQGHLDQLGFDPSHPRAWSSLPKDNDLYLAPDNMQVAAISEAQQTFNHEVLAPRFPLAWSRPVLACVPLGMSVSESGVTAALGDTQVHSQPKRNGLATFNAALFVDAHLTGSSAGSLAASAFQYRYQDKEQSLRGLHSLYFVPEIALIAVPDAVHPSWRSQDRDDSEMALQAAVLKPVKQKDQDLLLNWSEIRNAEYYEVQISVEPDFSRLAATRRFEDRTATLHFDDLCARRIWFRMRGVVGQHVSPWSNTEASLPALSSFETCDDPLPVAVQLQMKGENLNRCRFSWVHDGDTRGYEFEEAIRPDFADAVVLYEGTDEQFELIRVLEDSRYYRVRAWFEDDRLYGADEGALCPGPWSATQVRQPPAVLHTQLEEDSQQAPETYIIHRDLMRMAASRGDLFCVLGLPRSFREQVAAQWVSNLRAELAEEAAVSSYGAFYHPWVMTKQAHGGHGSAVRARPPEGNVLADYAYQTLRVGAWQSPANHPLNEVLGLDEPFDKDQWATFNGLAINLLRSQPNGFMPMTALTLSNGEWQTDRDVSDVNVRRLLIMLRRLAIREGDEWVFDNNTEHLQRQVKHQFESLLGRLYRRGALAGGRAQEAFQVVVDESVNTLANMDGGQLIVELRVAPSRPLVFLSVRLVQTGTGGLAVETA